MNRRKFLATSFAVTTGMLAGCGLPGEGDEEDEDDGEGGDGGGEEGEEEENEESLARPN